jgi:hypothetical protein
MRKLKLQMVTSIDGFVKADHEGADSILVGGKSPDYFIPYWKGVADNSTDPDHQIGKLLTDIPKNVFWRSEKIIRWDNASLASGDGVKGNKKTLKQTKGNDVIVDGGYMDLLINIICCLVAYGSGKGIFNSIKNRHLRLVKSHQYDCGIVLLQYKPKVN